MKSKKGFTLIELIVVLAILAIVAAIAVPTAFSSIENAKVAADKATIDSINSAIRMEAGLAQADPDFATKKATYTVSTALKEAGIVESTIRFQSKSVKPVWTAPSDTAGSATVGYFTADTTGTSIYAWAAGTDGANKLFAA